ncbi:hypothetical protein [Cereibacter johrii]|uniref:Uncharacterized protein n=1 Tax=Cereibacter johrii TaxID=445629 RepID=A0ABX5J2U0_9RHOB|nr:hypothetical protein [Cereibacter johrii]PTM75894.1 hypothetical protein C8J29_110114 [Cereibacter johrii]
MPIPPRPPAPPPALRSNPETFSANAEATILYQWGAFPTWIEAIARFTEAQAEAALTAALGGDLPPLAGKAGQFLRVKEDGSGPELVARPAGDALEAAAGGIMVKTSTGLAPRSLVSAPNTGIQILYGSGWVDNPTINGVTRSTAQWRDASDTTEAVLSPAKLAAVFGSAGAAPRFTCRAWVSFDGTGASPTIRTGANVSSITDHGTGRYTINFATPMQDENYALVSTCKGAGSLAVMIDALPTASGCTIRLNNGNGTFYDSEVVCVSVFR